MKTLTIGVLALMLALASAPFASAGVGSSIPVNGQHYNLNIIGAKNVGSVGDSNGHTMFVKMDGHTKIMMTQAADGQFVVTDRNGLDGSASFNIAPGHYNIYATALGKPNGKVNISAYGNFTDAVDGSTLIPLGYVDIARTKGSPTALNINKLFYVDVSLCTAADAGVCTETASYSETWVFDIPELIEYYWDYDNTGLKLLQVRLYPCTLDASGAASDYCRWEDGTPISSTKSVVSY
jgi:uncharacterized lipoprotein NlpE involved in copper resistance